MVVRAGLGIEVVAAGALVGFLAFVVAGLVEVTRRIEKRVGPAWPLPLPERPTPRFFMLQWLQLQLNLPGGRAKVRNAFLFIGAAAIAPYIALVIYNRA
jgi:hypothetical protein